MSARKSGKKESLQLEAKGFLRFPTYVGGRSDIRASPIASHRELSMGQVGRLHLSHKYLTTILKYESSTGIWTRRVASKLRPAGSRADYPIGNGYRAVRAGCHVYKAHRLAWFFVTGTWPTKGLDHRDGDSSNNRWTNLRPATDSQNGANSKKKRNNTSGLKGVCWNKRKRKWHSSIRFRRKQINLGTFDCPAAAHFAYLIAADAYFGEFARAR